MRPRKIASALSILLVVLSIFSLSFKGLNAGLDFTGGSLIEIKLSQSTSLEQIREVTRFLSRKPLEVARGMVVIEEVEEMGGMTVAVSKGFTKIKIENYSCQKNMIL